MTEATTADLMDAARAAGYVFTSCYESVLGGLLLYCDNGDEVHFHAITNADQLWLLAEKCGLHISNYGDGTGAVYDPEGDRVRWPSDAIDFRHAIVLAAARYWRARNSHHE